MTHDPATLAAVRERLSLLRRATVNTYTRGHDQGLDEAALMISNMEKASTTPPAPPPPPKRVEAWALVGPAGLTTYDYQQAAELVRMTGDRLVYLREQHGVHDAASAEAFAEALRWLMAGLEVFRKEPPTPSQRMVCGLPANIFDRIDRLAPFLPDAPR